MNVVWRLKKRKTMKYLQFTRKKYTLTHAFRFVPARADLQSVCCSVEQ